MGPTGKSNQIKGMPARLFQPHHLAAQLSYREPEPVAVDDHPYPPHKEGVVVRMGRMNKRNTMKEGRNKGMAQPKRTPTNA